MAGGFMVEETTWARGQDPLYPAWGSWSRWRGKKLGCPQLSMGSVHLVGGCVWVTHPVLVPCKDTYRALPWVWGRAQRGAGAED